jgi:hypothetical protein
MGSRFLVSKWKNDFEVNLKAGSYSDLEYIIRYFIHRHENLRVRLLVPNTDDRTLDFRYEADMTKEQCLNAVEKYYRLFFFFNNARISFNDKNTNDAMFFFSTLNLAFLLRTPKSFETIVYELKKTGAGEVYEKMCRNTMRDDHFTEPPEHKRLLNEFITRFNLRLYDVMHFLNGQLFFIDFFAPSCHD